MALSMHTNYASLLTQNTLNNTSNLLNNAMERLSTGYRVNSAADDAAGLQIANRLDSQTRGMNVAMRTNRDTHFKKATKDPCPLNVVNTIPSRKC